MTYLNPTKSISEVVFVYKLYSIHLTDLFLICLLSIINIKFLVIHYNNKKKIAYQKTIFFQNHILF